MNDITIEGSLLRSWSIYKRHTRILTLGSALILGASFFVLLTLILFFTFSNFLFLLGLLFAVLLHAIFTVGLIKVFLNITGNKKVERSLLWSCYKHALIYIAGLITYICIVVIGLVLFVVPGVIVFVRYSMWPFAMMNKGLGIFDSFKESNRLTKGSKMNLLFLMFALAGGLLISTFPLGLGLLVSCPVGGLTYAHVYRRLQLLRTNEKLQEKKKKEKVKAN